MARERRLSAIMFTDMVGYTALMGRDETLAHRLVERSRSDLESMVGKFHGQWLEATGDATLSAFPSAVEAVECAMAIQRRLSGDPELSLRIGIHLGDIVFADGMIYGDGVNVASRIEPLAEPGGIAVSEAVANAIRGHPQVRAEFLGRKLLKNVDGAIAIYSILSPGDESPGLRSVWRGLKARGAPRFATLYLLIAVAVFSMGYWLSWRAGVHPDWTVALLTGLIAFLPGAVLLVCYRDRPSRAELGRAGPFAIALNFLVAAILAVGVLHRVPVGQVRAPEASLAVLPLANMSADDSDAYFSDGMTEELIGTLSNLEGLKVAARTSSFAFKGRNENVRDIARKLGVRHVLEGSVRRSGEQLRISVQLVDAATGYQLWQRTYERRFEDVFAMQEEIARSVATQLDVVISPDSNRRLAARPTENLEAYNFYLRGLEYLRRSVTERNLDVAEGLFRNALSLDPEYAQAYSGLCRAALQRYELTNAPRFIDAGETACLEAMRLDESLHAVQIALGNLYRITDRLDKAEEFFRDVLSESPRQAEAWVGLGRVMAKKGPTASEEAERALRRAVELQPADWSTYKALADFLYWDLRFEEALSVYRRLTELTPDNNQAWSAIGAIHLLAGDMREGIDALKKSLEITPSRETYRNLGLAYFYLGDFESSISAYEDALKWGEDDLWSWGDYADALRHSGRLNDAQDAYAQAAEMARAVLAREPNNWKVQARLAVYLFHLGSAEKARLLMEEALSQSGPTQEVLYYGAQLDALTGMHQSALQKLRNAAAEGFPTSIIVPHPDFRSLNLEDELEPAESR